MPDASVRTLGEEAINYIRQRLEMGKTFAQTILHTLPLNEGSVVTYLPPDVTDEAAHKFKDGGKFAADPSTVRRYTDKHGVGVRIQRIPQDALPWVLSEVEDVLGESESRVCLVEDWTPRPSDPFWQKNPHKYVVPTFVGDEVYYVVFPHDSRDFLHHGFRHAGGAWPGVLAALTTVAPNDPIPSDRAIHAHQWQGLAERTTRLVVGAYDGEGYLIWNHVSS
jgi:hypothetical protein